MDGSTGSATLAVAAPGGLDDGIKRAEGPKHVGKIDVHASFDTLGGDKAARFPDLQPRAHLVQNCLPVGRAHVGGEMEESFDPTLLELAVEEKGVSLQVDDAKRLVRWGSGEPVGQLRPRCAARRICRPLNAGALGTLEKSQFPGHDLGRVPAADTVFLHGLVEMREGRLSRGCEENRGLVPLG